MASSSTTEFFNKTFRVTNSAVKLFNAIKPFHTHVLEVVEQYTFAEDVLVNVSDAPLITIIYRPKPDCDGEGWGAVYDAAFCGYSEGGCCEPFSCTGSYGLVWDNSSIFVQIDAQIADPTFVSSDYGTNQIIVANNQRHDTLLPILSYPATNQIRVAAGIDIWQQQFGEIGLTDLFTGDGVTSATHIVFELVGTRPLTITDVNVLTNKITVSTTRPGDIGGVAKLRSWSTGGDDVRVTIVSSTIVSPTEVEVVLDPLTYAVSTDDVINQLLIETVSANLGTYTLSSGVTSSDGYTVVYDPDPIVIDSSVPGREAITITIEGEFASPTEFGLGSLRLRTALTYPRMITVTNADDVSFESPILSTDVVIGEGVYTYLTVARPIPPDFGGITNALIIEMAGYDSGPGFDGQALCSARTDTMLAPMIYEELLFETQETSPPDAARITMSTMRFSARPSIVVVTRGGIETSSDAASSNMRFSARYNEVLISRNVYVIGDGVEALMFAGTMDASGTSLYDLTGLELASSVGVVDITAAAEALLTGTGMLSGVTGPIVSDADLAVDAPGAEAIFGATAGTVSADATSDATGAEAIFAADTGITVIIT